MQKRIYVRQADHTGQSCWNSAALCIPVVPISLDCFKQYLENFPIYYPSLWWHRNCDIQSGMFAWIKCTKISYENLEGILLQFVPYFSRTACHRAKTIASIQLQFHTENVNSVNQVLTISNWPNSGTAFKQRARVEIRKNDANLEIGGKI